MVANLQKKGVTLDLEERLIQPYSPLRAALFAHVFPPVGVTTYVYNSDDPHGAGLVQTRSRAGLPEEDVVFVAPALTQGNGAHALWQRLIAHLCVQAGERGRQRIYVRVPDDSDAQSLFKNTGFIPYATELVFERKLESLPETKKTGLQLRRQIVNDSWALQRLYAVVTPRAVQMAEGLAQGQWHVNPRRLGISNYRVGYVWESAGEVLAAMNVHRGNNGFWLRMIIHPEVQGETARLINQGLHLLRNHRQMPVYFSLRTYQQELNSHLEDCGFELFARQATLVKHTTVRAKDFLTRLVGALDPMGDPTPASPRALAKADASLERIK